MRHYLLANILLAVAVAWSLQSKRRKKKTNPLLYYFTDSPQRSTITKLLILPDVRAVCKVVILGGWLKSSHPLKSRELLSPIAIPAFRWYQVTGEGQVQFV